MDILTLTISFIINPITLVYIPVSVNQSAFSVGHILTPVSLIDRSIAPILLSPSMSLSVFPLSFIDRTWFEFIGTQFRKFFYILGIIWIYKLSMLLLCFAGYAFVVSRYFWHGFGDILRWGVLVITFFCYPGTGCGVFCRIFIRGGSVCIQLFTALASFSSNTLLFNLNIRFRTI